MHPNITPTQPKAITETKDQLDNNINQSLEAQPEEKKQRMEEQEDERILTNDEANPSKTEIQALKIEFDGQLEESKQVRIFLFTIRYSKLSGQMVKAIQGPGRIGTYG